MTKYFSPSKGALYDTDVVNKNTLPEDSVIVAEADYAHLIEQQSAGYVIVAGADKYPVTMPQTCPPCTNIMHDIKVASKTQLGHVTIGEGISVSKNGMISADIPAEMVGATLLEDGKSGIVSAPKAGEQNKFWRGNGEWATVNNLYRFAVTEKSWTESGGKYVYTFNKAHVADTFFAAFDTNNNELVVNIEDTDAQIIITVPVACAGWIILSSQEDMETITTGTVTKAVVADLLKTGRNIALTGAVTGDVTFDGSNDVSMETLLTDHTHEIAEITDLQTTLDGKAVLQHNHEITEVSGLETALDSKSDDGHGHVIDEVSGLQAALDSKSGNDHDHVMADVSGLQAAIDGKAELEHDHEIAEVNGLKTALDGKSDNGHGHAITDITGLQAALEGKSSSDHTHTGEEVRTSLGYVPYDSANPEDYQTAAQVTTAISGAVTSGTLDLAAYATRTWVEDKKYLAEHQDISGKADVDHAHTIADITGLSGELDKKADSADLPAVATSGKFVDLAEKPTTLAGYGITDGATRQELESAVEAVPEQVNADWNATTGKGQILNKPTVFAPDAHTHAVSDVNGLQEAIDEAEITSEKVTSALGYTPYDAANPSKYQTEAEVSAAIANAVSGGTVDLTGYAKETWVEGKGYTTKTYVDSKFVPLLGDTGNLNQYYSIKTFNTNSINIAYDSANVAKINVNGDVAITVTETAYGKECLRIIENVSSNDIQVTYPQAKAEVGINFKGTKLETLPAGEITALRFIFNSRASGKMEAFIEVFSGYGSGSNGNSVDLAGYATEKWVEDKGYITEHQDISGKANVNHAHKISDVTGLQTELDGKSASTHNHAIADVTELQSSLNSKADKAHKHTASDITDLTVATTSKAGLVKPDGTTIKVDADGKISAVAAEVDLTGYATEKWVEDKGYLTGLPIATTEEAGAVKPDGSTIKVDGDGIISTYDLVHGFPENIFESANDNAIYIESTSTNELRLSVSYATDKYFGVVKPDNSTITVDAGKLSVPVFKGTTAGLVPPNNSAITFADEVTTDPEFSLDIEPEIEDGPRVLGNDGSWWKIDSNNLPPREANNNNPIFINYTNPTDNLLEIDVRYATSEYFGVVKPDNKTITSEKGVISVTKPTETITTATWSGVPIANTVYTATVTMDSLTFNGIPLSNDEILFYFTSGTAGTTISLPVGTKYIGELTTEANKSYVISILGRVLVMGKIEFTPDDSSGNSGGGIID